MLSIVKIQELLGYVSYKPGWEFTAYDGKHEGNHLTIKTKIEDSTNPGHMVHLGFETFLPPFENNKQFFEWLLWRLKRIETHECREFFKVSGEVYDNPHKEFADRDL